MNLIIIYGPPAVGKLTVGKELSKITNYKLFHNHLTFDAVEAVFDFDDPIFFKLLDKIRIEIIETAAKEKIKGMILTFCYDKPADDKLVKNIIKAVQKHKGKVKFVQLVCNKDELFKRVKSQSRKKFNKIKSVQKLKGLLKKWNLFNEITFAENFMVDNTSMKAKDVAKKIKNYYKL